MNKRILLVCVVLALSLVSISNKVYVKSETRSAVEMENATVTGEDSWLYLPKDISYTGRNHFFEKGERITIVFCDDGYCMAEKYYEQINGSYFGWIDISNVSMDSEL